MLMRMDGRPAFVREKDVSILALLIVVGPQTSVAWACNHVRRTWTEPYQELWSRAFAWPNHRDPVYLAQHDRCTPALNCPARDST